MFVIFNVNIVTVLEEKVMIVLSRYRNLRI